MPTDRLYDLAFQFRKTKLWTKLFDSQLFAVKHADGTISYCCVMGALGEHLALAVYPGLEGLASCRRLSEDLLFMDGFAQKEAALSQNCAMVSFVNKDELRLRELDEARRYCKAHQFTPRGKKAYPEFQRFKPCYFPWYLDEAADQARLLDGLEACLEVSRKLESMKPQALGFTFGEFFERSIPLLEKKDGGYCWTTLPLPEPLPAAYPSPKLRDDLALARLKKSKKQGGEWACDVFMHLQPMIGEPGNEGEPGEEPKNAPFFPYLLLIVDNHSGLIIALRPLAMPEDYETAFVQTMMETLETSGRPSRIVVNNERAWSLFSDITDQLEVDLLLEQSVPQLEEAKENFFMEFCASEGDEEEDGSQFDQILAMLGDAEFLKSVPDAVLMQLAEITAQGMLPEGVVAIMDAERRRRGLGL